jgi:MscS family membrane protein
VVITAALPMLQNLFTVLVVVGCGLWLLDLWKINITPLLASAGIATAAVALAAKDTLANFFGGLSIIIDAPYRLGDYVVLDSGERGEVVHIGIRSTRILTRDDVQITVPNAAMANAMIVNQTAPKPRFRVRCRVGVSYGSDPNRVEEVMLSATRI